MTDDDAPAPFFVMSMAIFDRLCSYDPRYRPLLIEIGLDPEGLQAMLTEVSQSMFDRKAVIDHQISWLRSVYAEINPVKRRTNYRPLTPGRARGIMQLSSVVRDRMGIPTGQSPHPTTEN